MILDSQVALLSFYTSDFQPLHDVTGPVKDEYCARHGYRHIVKGTPYRATPGYYAYDRLAYIRDLFWGDLPEGRGIEVILVMNGHAQVMNHTLTVQRLLDPQHDFYIAADVHGINAGVFIIRKSDWSKGWLDYLLSVEQQYAQDSWHEQKAIQDAWSAHKGQLRHKLQLVDQRLLNAYIWSAYGWPWVSPGQFVKGDWILHIPGRSIHANPAHSLMESRIALFQSPEVLDLMVR